jgi:hypothetical protein
LINNRKEKNMFGALYFLANLVGLTVGYVKNENSNTNSREEARKLYEEGKNRAHTYWDTEGNERDITTNHKIFTYRDHGDLIVKDLKTGIERNIDKPIREAKLRESRKENIRKAKENGGIAECGFFNEKEWGKEYRFLWCQRQYIDAYGNSYVKRYFTWNTDNMTENRRCSDYNRIGCFYVNVKNSKIDYIDISDAGKVYNTNLKLKDGNPEWYDVLYANEKESKIYQEYYNTVIIKKFPEGVKFLGAKHPNEYKMGRKI